MKIFDLARLPQRRRGIETIDEVAVGSALGSDRRRAQHQRRLGGRHLGDVGERPGLGHLVEPAFGAAMPARPRRAPQRPRRKSANRISRMPRALIGIEAASVHRHRCRVCPPPKPRSNPSCAMASTRSTPCPACTTIRCSTPSTMRADRLRVIHPRHEQTAAYMALGAALATGKPQAFAVVPGPGLLECGRGAPHRLRHERAGDRPDRPDPAGRHRQGPRPSARDPRPARA